MPAPSLYPPAPAGVPADLTRPDAAYRSRAAAMILGLILFAVFYLALIALVGYLSYKLFTLASPEVRGRGGLLVLIAQYGGAFSVGLLALFLVKGLFKGQRVERNRHVALKPEEHPELFAFIRQVYADTGAPAPRRVYVSPDVNAALIYNTSVVNLIVPPKKDLLIGLGLVNVVTLAEFKAVLAHEFGHFAQRSVGLGSYLYVANRVMHDVIYSRDALDKMVDVWASIDIRISFPAWGLKGALWAIRGVLSQAYKGLNLAHLSLGRQMEFNADNVAVSVTGSDALIHCLSRLEFANECLGDAAQSLSAAADHDLRTDDLFHHQTQSADRLRRVRKDPRLGLPPELPDDPTEKTAVFRPIDDGVPEKYRTHPTEYQREQNAKRVYIRSPQDDRSPWLLFADDAGLKRAITALFYREALGRPGRYNPVPAVEVQAFIDAEHAETSYDPRYHGLYDDRFLDPGDLLPMSGSAWPADKLTAWFADWPAADLERRMAEYNTRQGESQLLNGLKSGQLTLKGKSFTFRDEQYTTYDVKRLAESVDRELTAATTAIHALDREVFLAHWSLARQRDEIDGGKREAELLERYRFHADGQKLLRRLLGEEGRLQWAIQVASANQQLDENTYGEIRGAFHVVHRAIENTQTESRSIRTPALTNVPAGTRLYDLLAERSDSPAPDAPDGTTISGEWVSWLATRLGQLLQRVKRVHFKSLGGLLAYQEKLAAEPPPTRTETPEREESSS